MPARVDVSNDTSLTLGPAMGSPPDMPVEGVSRGVIVNRNNGPIRPHTGWEKDRVARGGAARWHQRRRCSSCGSDAHMEHEHSGKGKVELVVIDGWQLSMHLGRRALALVLMWSHMTGGLNGHRDGDPYCWHFFVPVLCFFRRFRRRRAADPGLAHRALRLRVPC